MVLAAEGQDHGLGSGGHRHPPTATVTLSQPSAPLRKPALPLALLPLRPLFPAPGCPQKIKNYRGTRQFRFWVYLQKNGEWSPEQTLARDSVQRPESQEPQRERPRCPPGWSEGAKPGRPRRGASSARGGASVTRRGRMDLALSGPSPPAEDKRRVTALEEVLAAVTLMGAGSGR